MPEKSGFREVIGNNRWVELSICPCGERVSGFVAKYTDMIWNALKFPCPLSAFCRPTGINHFPTENCCLVGVLKFK